MGGTDELKQQVMDAFGLTAPAPLPSFSATALAVLVQKFDEEEVRRFSIGTEGVWIGRDSSNAIVLDHGEVSGRHAYIGYDGTACFVLDQSTNGTYLDQESEETRLSSGEHVRLAVGQRLVIADFVLTICAGNENEASEPAPPPRKDASRAELVSEATNADRNRPDDDPFESIKRMRDRLP